MEEQDWREGRRDFKERMVNPISYGPQHGRTQSSFRCVGVGSRALRGGPLRGLFVASELDPGFATELESLCCG